MILLPNYIHTVNPKLKHTYLSFNDEGVLVVKSPEVSVDYIEKLLLKKSAWINKSRKKLALKKGRMPRFSEKELLYFLGTPYPLHLQPYDKKQTKLHFDDHRFILHYNIYDPTLFQKHVDNFYKKQSMKYLPAIVEQWSALMGLEFTDIKYRKTKRQWGSCSAKNILSFNTMIMKLPKDVIDYIVVHELAHIKHKHHQKAFWAYIENYLPAYRKYVEELKHYTT
jgi:predicted metal-dependent hydrolase